MATNAGAALSSQISRSEAADAETVDGRRLRGLRSREAVVDALLRLYDEGELRPGAAEIARRAGVSERSVFRHFEDLDALVEAGITVQFSRIGHLFVAPPGTGSRAQRVASLAEQRLAIHEAAASAVRAASLLLPESPRLRAAFAFRRKFLADQVSQLFSKELSRRALRDSEELLDALVSISSLEHIEELRVHLGLSSERARPILIRSLSALLSSRPTSNDAQL